MNFIIFLITWFLSGILSFIFACVVDMRNKEYDKNYFNDAESVIIALFILFAGYVSIVVVFINYLFFVKNWSFTRLMYNIANIGVKKK